MLNVVKVAEDVHLTAPTPAGAQLHAGNDRNSPPHPLLQSCTYPADRVVVRKGNGPEALFCCQINQFLWRQGPIRGCRVDVEVNHGPF